MKGRRGNPGLCGKLLDKSVEAYILALETINRLSIQYRVEIAKSRTLILIKKTTSQNRLQNGFYEAVFVLPRLISWGILKNGGSYGGLYLNLIMIIVVK